MDLFVGVATDVAMEPIPVSGGSYWMTELATDSRLGVGWRTVHLTELTIIGTHHSATGDRFDQFDVQQPGNWWPHIVPGYCRVATLRNQKLSVAQQLELGVRLVDLRVMRMPPEEAWADEDGLVIPDTLFHHHAVRCQPIATVLGDVVEFLSHTDRSHELVLVEVQFDCVRNSAIPTVDCRKTITEFVNLVDNTVPGGWVVQRDEATEGASHVTLGRLYDLHRRLMFIVEDLVPATDVCPALADAAWALEKEALMEETWKKSVNMGAVHGIHDRNVALLTEREGDTGQETRMIKLQQLKKVTFLEMFGDLWDFWWSNEQGDRDILDDFGLQLQRSLEQELHLRVDTAWRQLGVTAPGAVWLVDRLHATDPRSVALMHGMVETNRVVAESALRLVNDTVPASDGTARVE